MKPTGRVYSFPRTVATNDRKFDDLKQQNLFSDNSKLGGQDQSVGRVKATPQALGKKLPCLFLNFCGSDPP